ncbi:MAG: CPBP family intramembrane glutamic endopeptidase [Thermoproteota archaeon]
MLQILLAFIQYLPHYIFLVVIPSIIIGLLEKRLRLIEDSIDHASAYSRFVISSLYFPIFEEILFRGLMFYFFGVPGLILGSITWILLHPAWQLKLYNIADSGMKKLSFFLLRVMYYSLSAIFFGIIWLDGNGVVAVIYHIFHNSLATITEIATEAGWKLPRLHGSRKFVRRVENPVEEFSETRKFIRKVFITEDSSTSNKFVKRKRG